MIGPGSDARVLIAARPVDFRKGADSLAALLKADLGADPFSGVVYVFRAKKADRVKLVWWDGTGLCPTGGACMVAAVRRRRSFPVDGVRSV